MLHKAWNNKGEMPCCFPRSSIKFQGHTGQNITDFDPNWAFPDYRPVAAFKSLRFALFKDIRQIARSHGSKNHRFWPKLGVSGLLHQFGITDGYEMMHKAWSSIEVVPYSVLRSSVKFQGHTALKIVEFHPNWAFPDCNFSLNSPMAMKCCTKLQTAKERCPIVFQGHPSNFKVTQDKTSPILTQIGRFRTIGRSQLSNPSDLPCWLCSHHRIIMTFSGVITNDLSKVHVKVKVRGQRSRSQRSQPNLTVSGL